MQLKHHLTEPQRRRLLNLVREVREDETRSSMYGDDLERLRDDRSRAKAYAKQCEDFSRYRPKSSEAAAAAEAAAGELQKLEEIIAQLKQDHQRVHERVGPNKAFLARVFNYLAGLRDNESDRLSHRQKLEILHGRS